MSFLVPGFALLSVLAGVPILIHLLGRPRAERRRFAAMRFLLRSDRKTAARHRLRQILLLVARALVLAVVPLLLAKPMIEVSSELPAGLGGVESAVIVLDDSRSMGYRLGGDTLFARAQQRARAIVDGMGRGSECAVLLASRGTTAPAAELTGDRGRLRQAVVEAHLSRRPGDTTAALKRAASILAAANHPSKRVYLVSDLAAHGFVGDPPWPAEGPSLVPVDVGEGKPLANRALTGVRTEPAPELGQRGVRIIAEVANFSNAALHNLEVTLRVDGKPVAKGLLDVPAHGRASKRFVHAFHGADETLTASAETLSHDGEIVIGADATTADDPLADDDHRWFRLEERRSVRVLLVDGDPRTVRRDDEVYYAETALHPGDLDDFQFDVTVAAPDELGRRLVAASDLPDVVVLANVAAPDRATAVALSSFVERGGGLLLSVGGNVDPDAWNAAFGALLPQPLATMRTIGSTLDGRNDGEARQGGAGEHIGAFDRRHPVLEPFGSGGRGPAEALREARVGRLALLKPAPHGDEPGHGVLLRLDGGAPLLVEGRRGGGRVLMLTTTLDRDWSDLAIQPGYLPLVQQAVRYLAGALLREPQAPALVGQPRELRLTDGDAEVAVTTPSGKVLRFDAERTAGRHALTLPAVEEPGVYHVTAGPPGHATRRPSSDFAVNLDPVESDLTRIDGAKLAALEHPGATVAERASPKRRVELWHALGAALLLLLLLEGALAVRRA